MRRMTSQVNIRKITPFALAFSVICAVQIIFLSILPSELSKNESPDFTVFYSVIADRLAAGESFESSFYFKGIGNDALPSDETGYFVTRWPPGHSIIIGAIYSVADHLVVSRNKLTKFIFFIFYTFSSYLIYKITKLFFQNWIPALSAIIWATYPFNLWLTKQPNSEIPFLIFLYWSIYLFIIGTRSNSTKHIIGASVLISISMLTRAASILVPIIFVIIYLIYAIYNHNLKNGPNYVNILKKSLIMIIIPIVVTAPWEIIVYKETGKILPLTSTGSDLIRVANMNILKPRPDGSLIVSNDLKVMLVSTLSDEESCSIIEEYCDLNTPKITVKPTSFISAELYWIKFKRAFYGVDTKRFEDEVTIIQWLYFIPAAFGLVLTLRKRNTTILTLVITGLSLYFLAINIIGLPLLRYMLPAYGLYAIYAACSVDWLYRKLLTK